LINAKSVPPCLNVGSHNLITTYELAGKIIRLTKSKSSRKTMNILDATYAVVSIPGFIETIRWKPEISLEAGLLASLEFSNSF
jgi:hypothetical protein